MTSISIDFQYETILMGGLNRLISMISVDFRYRFLSINYVWCSIILANSSVTLVLERSKLYLLSDPDGQKFRAKGLKTIPIVRLKM